jgi:hypothetical protein
VQNGQPPKSCNKTVDGSGRHGAGTAREVGQETETLASWPKQLRDKVWSMISVTNKAA